MRRERYSPWISAATPLPLDDLSERSLSRASPSSTWGSRRPRAPEPHKLNATLGEPRPNCSNGWPRGLDAGDRAAALATIDEAVDIRRQLAEANPAAFLPDLAMSLNNLSIRQADTGDRRRRAGRHRRSRRPLPPSWPQANPAAFLPDLAESLNNLSNRQADPGTAAGRAGRDHRSRRPSAASWPQANPAAFLPDLAMSLNNLSDRLADAGDRAGALAAIDEAVDASTAGWPQANPTRSCPTSPRR